MPPEQMMKKLEKKIENRIGSFFLYCISVQKWIQLFIIDEIEWKKVFSRIRFDHETTVKYGEKKMLFSLKKINILHTIQQTCTFSDIFYSIFFFKHFVAFNKLYLLKSRWWWEEEEGIHNTTHTSITSNFPSRIECVVTFVWLFFFHTENFSFLLLVQL